VPPAVGFDVERSPVARDATQTLLQAFQANRTYSFIGSSLLFIHDGRGIKSARRPLIRMIDFAHVSCSRARGPADEGYIAGLRTLIQCVPPRRCRCDIASVVARTGLAPPSFSHRAVWVFCCWPCCAPDIAQPGGLEVHEDADCACRIRYCHIATALERCVIGEGGEPQQDDSCRLRPSGCTCSTRQRTHQPRRRWTLGSLRRGGGGLAGRWS
jgi:hypothetical protein